MAGWPECPLFNAFAYTDTTITDSDYEKLESGVCPRRVSGTMMVGRSDTGGVAAGWVDLSSPAVEGGIALAQAIREYIENYHE